MCGALLTKFAAFRERCVAAKRVVETALARLHYRPISTNLIRSVDRVAHKLVLELTLGLDAKVINMYHDDNDEVDLSKCIIQYDDPSKIIIDMDDTDGLTDVLNDFEEIRNSLNEVDDNIGFNDSEFNDINHENFEGGSFNEHVDRLLRGKEMNNDLDDLIKKTDFNVKSISNGVKDIANTEFKGKDVIGVEKPLGIGKNLAVVKKALQEDDSNSFNDSDDLLNANTNDSLPEDINLNDVSINTTDLNDNDNSNLVETFNNFIFDHDYLDEKFLIETGDTEITKGKKLAVKKTDEDAVPEASPKVKKRDKLQLMKEITKRPVKRRVAMKPRKKLLNETVGTETTRPTKNLKSLKAKYEEETDLGTDESEVPDDENDDDAEDFVKFGNDFNFRIFVMSREEQLEELQKKREGVFFLGAPYKCERCAKGFRSEVTYKNHMKVHDIARGRYPCGVCGARHASAARRRRHAAAHRHRFCCTRCEFVARTREKAEEHFEWHAGKTYPCDYCGEAFGKQSTRLSHVRARHPGACAACAACGEAFVGRYGLLLHMRRMHSSDSQTELVELYCFTCRMQFKNRAAFQRHKAISGRACFPDSRPCAECGEDFETDACLLQHRRLRHSDQPLQCQLCEATFANATSRQTHVERAHLGVRPSKRDDAARVKSATPPKKKVMCEICGNKYYSAAALRYHQRAHSGERPHACPRCPKAFAFAYTLQAHERTHTGERPFRCARCARAFRTATNLARHRRAVHLGQKHYSRCWICLKWLTTPSAVKLHVATVHNDAPWPRKQQLQ